MRSFLITVLVAVLVATAFAGGPIISKDYGSGTSNFGVRNYVTTPGQISYEADIFNPDAAILVSAWKYSGSAWVRTMPEMSQTAISDTAVTVPAGQGLYLTNEDFHLLYITRPTATALTVHIY